MKERRRRARPTPARAAQLRESKRRQRARQRRAGIVPVQLELPAEQAERLRAARRGQDFARALDAFLESAVVDVARWPVLGELAWNRRDRWIPADEALALYERNWRFVDAAALSAGERRLIEDLRSRPGRAHG